MFLFKIISFLISFLYFFSFQNSYALAPHSKDKTFLARSLSNLSSSSTKDFDFKQKAENIKTALKSYSDKTHVFFPKMKPIFEKKIIYIPFILCFIIAIICINITIIYGSYDYDRLILSLGIISALLCIVFLIKLIIRYTPPYARKKMVLTATQKNLEKDIIIFKNQAQSFFQKKSFFIVSQIQKGSELSKEEIVQIESDIKTHTKTLNNLQKDIKEIQHLLFSKFPYSSNLNFFSYLTDPVEELKYFLEKTITVFEALSFLKQTIQRSKNIKKENLKPFDLIFQEISKKFFTQNVFEMKKMLKPLTHLLYKKISQASRMISHFSYMRNKITEKQKYIRFHYNFLNSESEVVYNDYLLISTLHVETRQLKNPRFTVPNYWFSDYSDENSRAFFLLKLMKKMKCDLSFEKKEEPKVLFTNNKQDKIQIILPNYEQESDTIMDPYYERDEQDEINFEKIFDELEEEISKKEKDNDKLLENNPRLNSFLKPMLDIIDKKFHEIAEIWVFLEYISFLTNHIFEFQDLPNSRHLIKEKKQMTNFFPKMSQTLRQHVKLKRSA